MIDANTRLIAQIKLGELRRQRDRLLGHYAALEKAATEAADPREQLRLLYRGLQEAKFAQKPLHPDVANLEALLLEAELGTASPEMLDQWRERLRQEVAQGRLRAEFAHIFGHLLDDWMAAVDAPAAQSTPGPHPFDETLQLLWAPPETPLNLDLLRELFARHQATFEKLRAQVRAFAEKEAQAAVTPDDVQALLKMVSNDITRDPEVRRQAMTLAADPMQVNEYAGALTILLNNLDTWNWPAEGFPLRPLWSRTKWRPYLDEDLLTLLFQSLVGLRWGMLLKRAFQHHINQTAAADEDDFDEDDDEGEAVTQPQQSSGQPFGPSSRETMFTWSRLQQHDKLFLPMIPNSLTTLGDRGGYGGYEASGLTSDGVDTFQELLLFVNAEIRLARARHPNRPLFVVQTDLRDYYLRIPHKVVLYLLTNLGFSERWLAFFGKFLAVRVRHGGQQRVVQRGLMLDHVLSDVFADYLLLLLDLHVHGAAGIRPLRVVDDIFLLSDARKNVARAWRAVGEFCKATGLEVNDGKSGSVGLGGDSASKLPPGPPRWGMLRLTSAGEWELDAESWGQFVAVLRRQVDRPMPVLTLISLYNSSLRYILKFLGFQVPLGAAHRRQLAEALARLHTGLFGAGHGLLEEVRRRWQSGTEQRIPEALFYWPLTAGGLGLFNPVTALAAYHDAALERPTPPIPSPGGPAWQRQQQWGDYLRAWLEAVQPRTPAATPGLEALLDDFAARSGEVAGRTPPRTPARGKASKPRKQRTNLSVYWQWAVYTYGPQLLATLGTFRFLVTELVPLQLIVQNRIHASSLSAES